MEAAAKAVSKGLDKMAKRSNAGFQARKKVDRQLDLGLFFFD
jgi:hypothetical protein